MSRAGVLKGFPCPTGKTIFVWASNQPDKTCLNCGRPFSEHVRKEAA